MRRSWEDVDCVFVRAPACPQCGSLLYDKKRTDRGEYARVKKVICRQCENPYKIIVENTSPDSGDEDF